MEQLTKNQAVATSQEAVQNQNEPQLRDENAHNDKSVHGVLIFFNDTATTEIYALSLHDALPISFDDAEKYLPPLLKKRGKPHSDFSASLEYLRSEEHTSELQSQSNLVCRLLLEKKRLRLSRHLGMTTLTVTYLCTLRFFQHTTMG